MRILILSAAAVCGVLALGLTALICFGTEPPGWLLRCEMAILSAAALLFGFAGRAGGVLQWLRLRSIRGAALVCCGVLAIYLPPQFVISAVLVAVGTRLVWAEACELAAADRRSVSGTAVVRVVRGAPEKRTPGNGQANDVTGRCRVTG